MPKAFPLHALLTLATGRVWGPFGEARRLADHLMGHPVWTHELPGLRREMERRVLAYLPALADIPEADYPAMSDDETAQAAKLAAQVARFGDEHFLPAGTDQRSESPAESLARIVWPDGTVTIIEG